MLLRAAALVLVAATATAFASPAPALSPRYDHSAIGASAGIGENAEEAAEHYARLILWHAVLGFVAFQIVAPLAVVIAAVGKSWGPVWFKAHWRMQMFFVVPATLLAALFALTANKSIRPSGEVNLKHQITGYVLLGALCVQACLGYYSHHRQATVERFAAETGRPAPQPKRRLSNWMHMALGTALLTVGGLEVTWGFDAVHAAFGADVPLWIQVSHWVIAGIPVLIVVPFVIVRGILLLRRGASIPEAFFTPYHSSSSSLTSNSAQPPRKLFLNSATYLSTPVFDVDLESEKANHDNGDGVGHAYAHGPGAEGRMRVDNVASSWPGAETREEYEAEVQSSRAASTIVGSSADSFAGWTTVADDCPQAVPEKGEHRVANSELVRGPPQVAPPATPAPAPLHAPTTYPPAPASLHTITSSTPSLPPLPRIFSPVSAPAAPLPPAAAATASPLSPRLSFMPFAGGTPAHAPVPSASPASVAGSRATTVEAEVRTPPAGEGESPSTPVLVPTPEAWQTRGRQGSLAAQVVQAATLAPAPVGHAQGELLPLPGEPDAPQPAAAAASESAVALSISDVGAVENGSDDAESTRLMDELERELTISTMRSGRSGRTAVQPDAAVEQGKQEEEEGGTKAEDGQTQLEREQSGKWFGSNRLSSSS